MSGLIHRRVPNAGPPPPSSLGSHAVEAAGWLHVKGQLPTGPHDPGAPLRANIEAQAELCFENLRRILDHTGFTFADTVNTVYARHFPPSQAVPSRTAIGLAALGRDALVEVNLVCFSATRA